MGAREVLASWAGRIGRGGVLIPPSAGRALFRLVYEGIFRD
jgi:hypothetical protein